MLVAARSIDEFGARGHFRAAFAALVGKFPCGFRQPKALVAAVALCAAIWFPTSHLSNDGKLVLTTIALCIVAWTMTKAPDSLVAIAGAIALSVLGVLPAEKLYGTLGNEIIWLLISAFIIAAVLRASGLIDRVLDMALAPFSTVSNLFYALTLLISLTAFLIPSTSGRAALLLPAFLALAARLPAMQLVKPLALLFPSVILLSAGGSLIGAGAHFVATDAIEAKTGQSVSYLQWLLLAFPFSLLSSYASCWLILRLFVGSDERRLRLRPAEGQAAPFTPRQKAIALVVLSMIAAWASSTMHGFDIALVAVAGAALLMSRPFTDLKPKELFRNIEMELILFLAATSAMAEAMRATGTDKWMTETLVKNLPSGMTDSFGLVVAVTAIIALLSHIVINSRTARAAVLVPVLALPMAGFGHDTQTIILVVVLGSGFCQTMMASAKPVAIYGNLDQETFQQGDLMRLAVWLLPIKFALLMAMALFVWPTQRSEAHIIGRVELSAGPAVTAPILAQNPPTMASAPAGIFPGSLCTRDALKTVMIAEISEYRFWASGWWRIWRNRQRDGISVEKDLVKSIYRADHPVHLRGGSLALKSSLDRTNILKSISSCTA